MDIPLEKWLVMALLTAISIFLGLLPYILVRTTKSMLYTQSSKYKVILTILSCFGAGVLFSTSLLHLLPEVRESFHGIPSVWQTFDSHFPIAEVVVICGFCLIYLVEEIAHFIMVDGHHGHHHHINTVVRHNSIAHSLPIPNVRRSITSARGSVISHQLSPTICITVAEDETSHLKQPPQQNVQNMSSITESGGTISSTTSSMDEQCPDDKDNFASSLRTFLALIALSFHAIMEGVAIGLQSSSNVWVMFGAVASHKFVISFCMGMELVASETKPLTYVTSIIFFAVISPIGIIIGSVLASDDSAESLPVTVIEGLACGTLLYVVFFEILNRERERKSYSMSNSKAVGFIQFLALAVGLVSMGCLLTLTHGHGSESDDDHGDHSH